MKIKNRNEYEYEADSRKDGSQAGSRAEVELEIMQQGRNLGRFADTDTDNEYTISIYI